MWAYKAQRVHVWSLLQGLMLILNIFSFAFYAQIEVVVNIFEFLKFSFSRFSLFLAVSSVPGGLKKLREACRKIVHLVSSKSEAVAPSYDQQREKVND